MIFRQVNSSDALTEINNSRTWVRTTRGRIAIFGRGVDQNLIDVAMTDY